MSRPTVIILDFDGTMTDVEADAQPFRDGYLDDLSIVVGRAAGDAEVRAIALATERELFRGPDVPFMWLGHAVAPVVVDPYMRIFPIAHGILDHFGALVAPAERHQVLRLLYRYNYAKTLARPMFRPGAVQVLQTLANTATWIVTNSDTQAVERKLTALDREAGGIAWPAARVRGGAQKFFVDDQWTGVEAELAVPGLARPVLLRRRAYHDVLAAILEGVGATFADVVVIGDIFEFDLAMPLALGARVALVSSTHTPAYERAFVSAHPRGTVLTDVTEIPAYVLSA